MIKIKEIARECERGENKYTGEEWTYYPGEEEDFIKGVETLCNTIGENNIVSVQFLKDNRNRLESCIITYREP